MWGCEPTTAADLGGGAPIAVSTVEPIASGPDYASDVGRTRALRVLVQEGHAASLVEAALRFPLGSDAVSTARLLEPRAPRGRGRRRGKGALVPGGLRSPGGLLEGHGARPLTRRRRRPLVWLVVGLAAVPSVARRTTPCTGPPASCACGFPPALTRLRRPVKAKRWAAKQKRRSGTADLERHDRSIAFRGRLSRDGAVR